VVVNDMVNRAGISFAYRAVEETGVEFAEIARAYTVVREIFGLESLWRDLESLDGVVTVDAQLAAYSKIRRLIDRATRWLADVRFPIRDVGTEIARFAPAIGELAPQLPQLLCAAELTALETDTEALAALGLPRPLALRISELLPTFLVLDVVEIADGSDEPVRDVAALLYALSARLSVDVMLTQITLLPRADRWSTLARAALRHDIYAALKAITTAVLKDTEPGKSPQLRIAQWEQANQARVDRATTTVTEALSRDQVDLATLSVALRVMRGLSG
jgi:glutamate dehydrogenase